MNQRDKWIAERGLSKTGTGVLTYENQPEHVRMALAMVDMGSPRAIACHLTRTEPDAWDAELRDVEYHVEHRIAVRLFARFESGGDNRALEMWREHAGRFKGDSRTNYDRASLRDLFADNPVILQLIAYQEAQAARGQPDNTADASEGIPVEAFMDSTTDASEASEGEP